MDFEQDGIPTRLDSKIQKLIILFVFDKMAISLSEAALLDICTSENDWLTYMDCKQYLGELLDTNLLYRVPKSEYINITQDGIGCLALFFTRIPASIRDDINAYARENRMRYKKRQSYFCDYSKNADGTYTVIMKINSDIATLMEQTVSLQNISTKAGWTKPRRPTRSSPTRCSTDLSHFRDRGMGGHFFPRVRV